MPQIHFEAKSISGKKIRTTEEYWKLISEVKHPIIRSNDGYIISAYIADKMKKSDVIWQRKS